MKHNEMFELIIMWWLLLLVWSFVYSCLDGKIGNQYKIVVSCTSTAVNWDENSQDSPSSSTEMSMLTTYCGKHVQNLCVCNWTTLKNPRRIGRGKGTYSRRGAHSNYINNTWSLHRISFITFSIEYQNIRKRGWLAWCGSFKLKNYGSLQLWKQTTQILSPTTTQVQTAIASLFFFSF